MRLAPKLAGNAALLYHTWSVLRIGLIKKYKRMEHKKRIAMTANILNAGSICVVSLQYNSFATKRCGESRHWRKAGGSGPSHCSFFKWRLIIYYLVQKGVRGLKWIFIVTSRKFWQKVERLSCSLFSLTEVIPIAIRRQQRLSWLQTYSHVIVIDRQSHLFIAKHIKTCQRLVFSCRSLHFHVQLVWSSHPLSCSVLIHSAWNEHRLLSKWLAETSSLLSFSPAHYWFTHTRYPSICQ